MKFFRQILNPDRPDPDETVLPPEAPNPDRPDPDEGVQYVRDPGEDVEINMIFNAWNDLLDLSDCEPAAIADLAQRAVQYMRDYLNALLDIRDGQPSDFILELWIDRQDQPYLIVQWHEMHGEIGVRQVGRCLELFGILVVTEKFNLIRVLSSTGWGNNVPFARRRDLTIFHSILKYTLDQLAEAIDEQRIV